MWVTCFAEKGVRTCSEAGEDEHGVQEDAAHNVRNGQGKDEPVSGLDLFPSVPQNNHHNQVGQGGNSNWN